MRLKNIDVHTRIYNDLQRKEDRVDAKGVLIALPGSTLELDPGEEAEVEVPEELADAIKGDPFIKIVVAETPTKRRRPEPDSVQEQV